MAGSQNIINALKQYTGASHNEATNAANREVSAFDPERSLFVQGSGRRAAASPTVHYQRSRDVRGEMESTGRVGDLAIDRGQGFFVVKTRTGAVALSNMGSFRVSEVEQKIMGPSGEVLMGWELNAKGERPQNSSSLDSLVELSTKQLTAKAVATDFVSMSSNLKQEQKNLDGPGSLMQLEVHNIKKIGDLIAPGEEASASFFVGDQIKLTPEGGDGQERIFEYGGQAISRKPSTGNGAIFGATGTADKFRVTNSGVQAPDDSQLTFDSGFSITLGAAGATFPFRATTAANQAASGKFDSLSTLADAINATTQGSIRASISDGRLIVAPTNANDIITFTDLATPPGRIGFTEMLGLHNTIAPAPGVERYASLEEFRDKVVSVEGLTAEVRDGKKVFFGADIATSSLEVTGESYRPRNFRYAYASSSAIDSDRQYGVSIDTPSHGLVTGDYIRLDGGLAVNAGTGAVNIGNGIYRVHVSSSDRFTIFQEAPILTAAGVGNAPVQGARLDVTTANLDGLTWRKLEGNSASVAAGGANTAVAADGANADYRRVTLTTAGLNAIDQLAVDDIVFIQNSTVLNDGYYRVQNVAGAAITVFARSDNGVEDFKNPGVPAAGANIADANFTIQKFSGTGAALDPFPITIADGTRTVTVRKPGGHSYSTNDLIMFTDIAGPILAGTANAGAGSPTIRPNVTYRITVVDAETYTFEYSDADPTVTAAGGAAAIGYANRDTGAAGLGANINQDANAILGPNAQIQNLTKSFKGRGIETTEEYFNAALPATYDGASATISIHSGRVKEHHTDTATVYDSFGQRHQINVSYVKLSDKMWGVEVWLPKQPDATYDALGNNSINRLAYGNIIFDGNGNIDGIDPQLRNPIPVQWTNGAETSNIVFDFGGEEGKVGITMLAGPYDTRFLDPNGSQAGALEAIEYQEDGTVVARFTNGSSRAFAQLPVAVVPDANSLIATGGGHYVEALNKSGAIVLKVAGVGGAGTFLPGFLEASKSDENEALLNMTELNHLRSIALKAVSKEEEVNKLAVQLL